MTDPNPQRIDIACYPHSVCIQTRFADVDLQMHVNSVRMAEIFEDARWRFNSAVGMEFRPGPQRLLVVALNHTYLTEAHYPEPIMVGCAIIHVGRSSWTIGQAAFQHAHCVALCEITIVNARERGPQPISDDARQLLKPYVLLPTPSV